MKLISSMRLKIALMQRTVVECAFLPRIALRDALRLFYKETQCVVRDEELLEVGMKTGLHPIWS
jgi:hypothetical protein